MAVDAIASIAGLLTLALRKNHARVRYWVWLATSVRFLIPFSLLVGIGSYLPWSRPRQGRKLAFTLRWRKSASPYSANDAIGSSGHCLGGSNHLLPAILAAVWLCGFLVVIFQWYFRWREFPQPFENRALRRWTRSTSPASFGAYWRHAEGDQNVIVTDFFGPGILALSGLFCVAEGICERLEDAHLEVILAHELCHVRRRDNLAAALHMVVEAIFWFHPLVWWLEARMMEERERACDEEVQPAPPARQNHPQRLCAPLRRHACLRSAVLPAAGFERAGRRRTASD